MNNWYEAGATLRDAGAETGARNIPRKGRNTENYRPETWIRQRNRERLRNGRRDPCSFVLKNRNIP
jgi:hypothetical protein